jgi:hypothetical protein
VCVQADYMTDDANDPTSDRFLEVYPLWLFGWVLFCESARDSVSWYMIPWAQRIADAPLEQMPQISWGSAILGATYIACVRQCRGRQADVDPRAVRHRSAQGRPLGVRAATRRQRPSGPPHHGFCVVPPAGNDLPYCFFAL